MTHTNRRMRLTEAHVALLPVRIKAEVRPMILKLNAMCVLGAADSGCL